MAKTVPEGPRGRRKQAKPQRKVDAGNSQDEATPDDNHNHLQEKEEEEEEDEEDVSNGLSMKSPVKATGGVADQEDVMPGKVAEEEEIQEYLQRRDTAVIFAEPVGHDRDDVPPLTNGVKEELSSSPDSYIECPQCQKGCHTVKALREHIEAAHPELESSAPAVSPTPGAFSCSQCSSSFSSKDQLEKHELLHSPNAQVSCKTCSKTFANVYRLQRHMISHDESAVLRKFKCTECDKAFKFKHHLKEHIRIHSGEKPFECGNCGKRFSHSGSYSSHMTSKKCLVMNLKLGRTRAPSNTMLDKNRIQKKNVSPINNNITTSPNHNSYLPILPKYSEAAAAFFQSSLSGNPSLSPFLLAPTGLLNAGHPISPYTMPAFGHLLEQLQQRQASPNLRPEENVEKEEKEKIKEEEYYPKSELVICVDEDKKEEKPNIEGDLVKRILDTVNSTVTKELFQANIQKNSDCSSDGSIHSIKQEAFSCSTCKRSFDGQAQLDEHECDVKSEGLAAKLEDAIQPKTEEYNGSTSGNEDQDYDRYHSMNEEMDCESETTTEHVSEDGRKVRVRSLISDDQLKVLKDNYKLNPRPKRDDLEKIASAIGFPVRVVQVWFQNTRARDRREGRLVQVPYNPVVQRYPSLPAAGFLPKPMLSPQYNEQPLDLSTKKDSISNESSPASTPKRPTSVQTDCNEEVVNLSKSSASPTSFAPYQNHYSQEHRSETPLDYHSSRLAHLLAQPSHKMSPAHAMGLMPMDLIQFQNDIPALHQLLNSRMTSLSPSSERRWNERSESESQDEDGGSSRKRSKVSHFVLKNLGSPVLGNQEAEPEGQFSCDQCDKSFSKQSSLARHKYEHSGQRPHKCEVCPKAFKHKHHLTEHKRLHSGEKPFQCSKCLKRFSHSGSYSQHMNHRYSYCKPYRE